MAYFISPVHLSLYVCVNVCPLLKNGTIKNNNIELYNYLREGGYKVKSYDIDKAASHKSSNFSVGLVKAHFKEDNPEL